MLTVNYFGFLLLMGLTFSAVCGILALAVGVYALIEVQALKNSTHSMEYVPMDKWASTDEEVEEINERSEAEMPAFDENEDVFAQPDLKRMI